MQRNCCLKLYIVKNTVKKWLMSLWNAEYRHVFKNMLIKNLMKLTKYETHTCFLLKLLRKSSGAFYIYSKMVFLWHLLHNKTGNRINHRWVSSVVWTETSESTHHERFRVCRSSESERKRPMTRGLSASVRCEWHHQPAPSARRTFDLLIRFLVGGAACCKLSASFVLGCSFVAPFPNGTAVLWWDAKHHSKSPLFCPLCVSEATVSYHLEGPHPSVPLIFI